MKLKDYLINKFSLHLDLFKSSRTHRRNHIFGALSIILIGIIFYWHYSATHISTDDAYVNANVVQISTRVSGQVARLYVENNQFVKQGAPLFDLDAAPFQVAVEKARAQLAIAEATFKNAELTSNRTIKLAQLHVSSKQAEDDAVANLQSTAASVKLAAASLAQAELDLSYTHVVAPEKGLITNMTLRMGNSVTTNQPLFALINNDQYWVDANFKETELQKIRIGQPVTINIDMYPGHVFKGYVASISGGSGTAFSLLPPQNATGNWVKVTQRVPVKIIISNLDPHYPLRIGTTASVIIKITN